MNRLKAFLALGALALVSASGYGAASAQSAPQPIVVEPVTPRATFIDNVHLQVRVKAPGDNTQVRNVADPSRVVTAKVTVQPGARFPWHVHPGPVLVTVTDGDLVYVDGDDCSERLYPSGTAFFDVGNNVHSAFNPGTTALVFYATWFDVSADEPLTIPVEAPPCA